MNIGDLAPELVLVAGGAAVLVWALFAPRGQQGWAALIAAAAVLGAMGFTAALMAGRPHLTFSGVFALDSASLWSGQVILAATLVAVALSAGWFASDARHGEYYALVLFVALGAMLLAGATDLLEVVLGLLMTGIPGYTLAAYHRRSALSAEAGIKFFFLGAISNSLLLFGVVLLFGVAGTTTFAGLSGSAAGNGDPALLAGVVLVIVGLAFEVGAVPVHAWMPDVAQGAPAPAAALLTVVPKIGALIALIRFASLLEGAQAGWRPAVAVLATATMTVGNFSALWQRDVRRLLGWSAVSQGGYALMAVTALGRTSAAVPALVYFVGAYAAANLAAFGVVVCFRGRTALDDYSGTGRSRPVMSAVLVLALLSLVGIPPTAGFAAKVALFSAAIESGYAWLAAVAVANTVISLFYYLRVVAPMYTRVVAPMYTTAGKRPALMGRSPQVAALAAAAAVLVLGIGAQAVFAAVGPARLLP